MHAYTHHTSPPPTLQDILEEPTRRSFPTRPTAGPRLATPPAEWPIYRPTNTGFHFPSWSR